MKESDIVIEAYIYSSCTSCRKTVAQLEESGVPFARRDFFRNRFSREELAAILSGANLKPSDVLSTRSKVYKTRDLASQDLSEDQVLDLMIEEPTLLRRPLVIGDGKVVIGHNSPKLAELIAGQ